MVVRSGDGFQLIILLVCFQFLQGALRIGVHHQKTYFPLIAIGDSANFLNHFISNGAVVRGEKHYNRRGSLERINGLAG